MVALFTRREQALTENLDVLTAQVEALTAERDVLLGMLVAARGGRAGQASEQREAELRPERRAA